MEAGKRKQRKPPRGGKGRPAKQLRLLTERRVAWPLDPATRERGLRGVAQARQALDATQPADEILRPAS